MNATFDLAFAQAFADEWIAVWNSGDIDRILALYADDFEMWSPLIVERGYAESGILKGKETMRHYWGTGLAAANPPIRFELIGVYSGVNTLAIHYRNVGRKVVVEILEFEAERRVIRGRACHESLLC